jgi:flagellar export protein FliJ
MKNFQFRLQSVYDLRLAEKQEVEKSLQKSLENLQTAQNNLQNITKEKIKEIENYTKLILTNNFSVEEISWHTSYIESLSKKEKLATEHVSQMQREYQQKQQELAAATAKAKTLDKLRERDLKDHINETSKIEQLTIDELTILSFARRSK